MSEIPFRKRPQTIEATRFIRIGFNKAPNLPLMFQRQQQLLEEAGLERIGSGKENLVYVHPKTPDRVVAIRMQGKDFNPNRAKQLYYAHRMYQILFPHNFPRVFVTRGTNDPSSDSYHTGTIRERIYGKKPAPLFKGLQAEYPFSQVRKTCRRWKIPLDIDRTAKNFMNGNDGGQYFVDQVGIPFHNRLQTILPYMRANSYSQREIENVGKYVERIGVLQAENPMPTMSTKEAFFSSKKRK